ncbi:MAG: carbohydrate ABC transporter permease [Chloroflexi bacterium]|nr:carbohydrate ABC transporter permease [Chloroflexota bacterium]
MGTVIRSASRRLTSSRVFRIAGRRVTVGSILFWGVGMLLAVFWMWPFFWMVSTSLKPEREILSLIPEWLPREHTWRNYERVFAFPVLRWYWNSFVVAIVSTLLILLLNSLAGYAFARINFFGRNVLFVLVLTTLMMPFEALVIPLFIMMSLFQFGNTYFALIAPGLASAFGVFLFRQFFLSLPSDLEDAARIDGCGRWGIYWRIALPLAQPAVIALAILHFIGNWNSLFWPLIITNTDAVKTLPVGMLMFRPGFGADQSWAHGLAMAAATIQALPPLIVFFILQRYFMQGIATVGLKG